MSKAPPAVAFQITVPLDRMSVSTLKQLAAATAQAVQLVEDAAQRLALSRGVFREGLAEAETLNAAQSGLYRMDVGGAVFHTRTEVLQRHEGMLSVMASDDFIHVEGGRFLDRDPTWFPLVLHFHLDRRR